MSLFNQLADLNQQTVEQAQQRYADLVEAEARGESTLTPAEAKSVLEAAGKTLDVFRRDVEKKRQRVQAAKLLEEAPAREQARVDSASAVRKLEDRLMGAMIEIRSELALAQSVYRDALNGTVEVSRAERLLRTTADE